MMSFSTPEFLFAMQMARAGLGRAAVSMSAIMKKEIRVDESDFRLRQASELDDFPVNDKEDVCLLITHVKGELPGTCCLVFSYSEAGHLYQTALPAALAGNAEMQDAILLEMDNIISASVVTEFANRMNVKIYGDVPQLQRMSGEALRGFLRNQIYRDTFAINFKSSFITQEMNFTPEFIWFFDQQFVELIRNVNQTVQTAG
ncbi:MAG: hypothetical protein MUC87_06450 [Bacteroidia bacterium]|jgi:chemotaxis protein CheY-P-specific phosphatase CheC|nr:hypothetical protein [Bacteroidia bacterium]